MRIPLNRSVRAPDIPIGNYMVMVLMTVTFAIQFIYDHDQQYLNGLILAHWSLSAILGHMWLHASVLHIVCNLVVLWIFGRHVCLKIGNAKYVLAYVFVGAASAVVHIICDGRPVIGASGAIIGILGLHLVLCFRHFSLAGPWIVLIWYLLTLTVGIVGCSSTAFMAHVGGFLGGIVLAGLLAFLEIVECSDADQPLLCILRRLRPGLGICRLKET